MCIFPTAGVPVQYCEQPTNGISYFRAISSITDIPEELREYLPFFCYILTKYDVISFAAVLSCVLKATNFAVALVFCQIPIGSFDCLIVCDWLENSRHFINQSIKRVFPRFSPAACICFEFWLVHLIVCFVLISQSNYFVFLYRETLKITQRTLKFARGSWEK